MIDLNQDVKYVKGVGPNRVKLLNKLNIYTLKDLITYYPREHEDRSKATKIADAVDGEETLIRAVCVSKVNEIRTRRKNMTKSKLFKIKVYIRRNIFFLWKSNNEKWKCRNDVTYF